MFAILIVVRDSWPPTGPVFVFVALPTMIANREDGKMANLLSKASRLGYGDQSCLGKLPVVTREDQMNMMKQIR